MRSAIPKRRKREPMGVKEYPWYRSQGHRAFVRSHHCAIEGRNGHVCGGEIEAAHVRTGTDGCLGEKPSDWWCIPLCADAHKPIQHQIGEPAFEIRYGIDMKAIAEGLWKASPHRLTYEARERRRKGA